MFNFENFKSRSGSSELGLCIQTPSLPLTGWGKLAGYFPC